MVAFRRPKSLTDILVHSEMKTPVTDKGCCRCGDRRCRVCDFLVSVHILRVKLQVITLLLTLMSIVISIALYIFYTVTKFRTRFNAHRRLTTENIIRLRMIVYTSTLINLTIGV